LLRAGGFDVALTREDDSFVSLERRVAIAHELGADVFISLHADALSEGRAHGATVYTLSDSASDEASAALAERHNRTNILAGIDLSASAILPSHESLLAQYAAPDDQPDLFGWWRRRCSMMIDEFARNAGCSPRAEEIPDLVKQAFISAEDKNFYNHAGL
jgi:hypothetical protein